MSTINSTTTSTFQRDVLDADRPVLVDFWAEWCAPCRMLHPVLDRLATERKDIRVIKVNVDDDPVLAQRFQIRGIPSMILFHNGERVATQVGVVDYGTLTQWLKDHSPVLA